MPAVRERPCVRRTHQERVVTQRASEPCGEETPVHVRKVGAAQPQDSQDDVAAAEERLASHAQLTLSVSYQQMIDALSRAPAQILSDAIESLQQAQARCAAVVSSLLCVPVNWLGSSNC